MAKRGGEKRDDSIAVAIDKDKSSQYALKWAVDHLLAKGQALTLLHVRTKASSISTPSRMNDSLSLALLLPWKVLSQMILRSRVHEIFPSIDV